MERIFVTQGTLAARLPDRLALARDAPEESML